MLIRVKQLCLTLTICFVLSGCGFHLRGPIELAQPLQRIYLQSQDPYGELSHNITQYLKASHVYMASIPGDATTVLDILREDKAETLLSVSGTQQTRQYNITLSVTFQLTTPQGVVILPPRTVSETNSLTIRSDQILGGSNEESNRYQQMRRIIVYTIMNILSSKEVTDVLLQKHLPPKKILPKKADTDKTI